MPGAPGVSGAQAAFVVNSSCFPLPFPLGRGRWPFARSERTEDLKETDMETDMETTGVVENPVRKVHGIRFPVHSFWVRCMCQLGWARVCL